MSLQAAEFESNVALSNDYVWRGMFNQKNLRFLVVSTLLVIVDFILVHGHQELEMELHWNLTGTGYANELENGFSYDIGYLAYTYPGEDSLDFEEIYLGLGYTILDTLFLQDKMEHLIIRNFCSTW